ncbi:MAG: SUMF1/EgtB/PvdO family nonheme iron enzyme [Myxococcales bacterium]|nr:SUMF1/EgtB/PvdO family nonheme iron enzyme [Myxococcales bacterium]
MGSGLRWAGVAALFAGGAVIGIACGGKTSPPRDAEASASPSASAPPPRPPSPADAGGGRAAEGASAGDCPAGMVLVAGSYCPKVAQTCLRWLDPPGPYRDYRCGEYKKPAECLAPREKKRFCIDREEYVAPGETLPLANQSWTTAGEVCASLGRRLCLESEWQFACEGEDMRPYPYGDGFVRDGSACNIDRNNLGKPGGGLADLRAPVTDYPKCVSVFGVHNMSGNIEEWSTLDEGKAPQRSSMKGAWWLPGKNTCRAATLGHGEVYAGKQVGVRCCKDPG